MIDSNCPYLEGDGEVHSCGASSTMRSPSPSELAEYCATDDHYLCVVLLARTLMNGSRRSARSTRRHLAAA